MSTKPLFTQQHYRHITIYSQPLKPVASKPTVTLVRSTITPAATPASDTQYHSPQCSYGATRLKLDTRTRVSGTYSTYALFSKQGRECTNLYLVIHGNRRSLGMCNYTSGVHCLRVISYLGWHHAIAHGILTDSFMCIYYILRMIVAHLLMYQMSMLVTIL